MEQVSDPPAASVQQAPVAAATGTPGINGPLTCDPQNPQKCRIDADCACGSSLGDGKCAYGTAACIDTEKQCPDFCTGITGAMVIACKSGTCVQGQK